MNPTGLLPGFSWIGWDDHGAVDRIDGEAIVTRFFCVVIPVWPLCSIYTCKRNGERMAIELPLLRRSVALGYLRPASWLTALTLIAPAIGDPPVWGHLLIPGAAVAVVAALLTFFAGRLGARERARRRLLRRVTGIGAPPELLPADVRHQIRTDLLESWHRHSPQRWQRAIADGVASELLVALADYHADRRLVAEAYGNLVVARRAN